jgi:hypothetical protein
MSSASVPAPQSPPTPDLKGWVVYLIRELGLTTALVTFICYLLAVQLPQMQADFRIQTDKLVEAVGNNNRIMGELITEIRALRRDRSP